MTAEVVIVGGGPAGAIAACRLAGAGRKVLLLEREAGPRHKVCGEFVSVEAQADLARIGVDVARLGAARIDTLRLVHGDSAAETRLPFEAAGLTRRALDEALLDAARTHGAEVVRGVSVRRLGSGPGSIAVDAGSLGTIEAPAAFLATGKHDLRGCRRDVAGTRADLIGFKMYFRQPRRARDALAGAIEVILFEGGYAGLQLVEDGEANLCLLVEEARFERLGGSWDALLAALLAESPHLARRLDAAEPLLARPLAIARVPYGFLHRADGNEDPGLFRLGDQAAVIPSFSGDGMAIALHSGRLAAETYLAHGRAAPRFHARLRRHVGGQIRLAGALQRAASTRAMRQGLVIAAAAFPGAMRFIARQTRVPPEVRLA